MAPGLEFILIGLWHLYNHFRLHSTHPSSYESWPWVLTPLVKYLGLFLIMFGCSLSVFVEQPLDDDGIIPSNHLHNFEHSVISFSLSFAYVAFAIVLERARAVPGPAPFLRPHGHQGTTPPPRDMSFLRSSSILFQGLWLVVMGFVLWTPGLIPMVCYMNMEEGHRVVRCQSDEALFRAKSPVNIQFGVLVIVMTVLTVSLYLVLGNIHGEKVEYKSLINKN